MKPHLWFENGRWRCMYVWRNNGSFSFGRGKAGRGYSPRHAYVDWMNANGLYSPR